MRPALGRPLYADTTFNDPHENSGKPDGYPEPCGTIGVGGDYRVTRLWEQQDLDGKPPSQSIVHAWKRAVHHPIEYVCANVGEDDTHDSDEVLAEGCVPFTGVGKYSISGRNGSVTVDVFRFEPFSS
ncbi:hypothetical protein [Streptomyces hoynatensis]|uniref:hypothetical protein n=1 Tax=Streptomyces hoynatensis TaxID=1141874 RepID=UPI001F4E0E33|nr:hypothetical protein [Streptomyces hoynatensis]